MNENTCKVEGCSTKIHAGGMCRIHYLRNHRYGSTEKKKCKREQLLEIGMSYCPRCKLDKPIEEFYKNKLRNHGKSTVYCKKCCSEKRKVEYSLYFKAFRNGYLKRTYGISNDDYDKILKKQNGGCGICGKICKDEKKLFPVDHDHKTGKIRGILCNSCNNGIGRFHDDVNKLNNAVRYLKHPTVTDA